MPVSKGNIRHLVQALGLIAPLTKLRSDWDIEPAVKELYTDGIDTIANRFKHLPYEEIRRSTDLRVSTLKLLETHAPLIWGRSRYTTGHRPWLFDLDDDRTEAKYGTDLYWDQREDRSFIIETFQELVIEKVIRRRKDDRTRRSSLSTRETDLTRSKDGDSHNMSRPSNGAEGSAISFRCWALSHDHMDASRLKNRGIWLGDSGDPDRVITDLSYRQVIKQYYDLTDGGRRPNHPPKGPEVNAYHSTEPDKGLCCAACRSKGLATQALVARHEKFCYQATDDEGIRASMDRTVWTFPSLLDGREVFALVRCEKSKRFDGATLWSFWCTKGCYTKFNCLSGAPKPAVRADLSQQQGQKGAELSRVPNMAHKVNLPGTAEVSRLMREFDEETVGDNVVLNIPQSPARQREEATVDPPSAAHRFFGGNGHLVNNHGTVPEVESQCQAPEQQQQHKRRLSGGPEGEPTAHRRCMTKEDHSEGVQQTPETNQHRRTSTGANNSAVDELYEATPPKQNQQKPQSSIPSEVMQPGSAKSGTATELRGGAETQETGGASSNLHAPATSNSTTNASTPAFAAPTTDSEPVMPPAPDIVAPREVKVRFQLRDTEGLIVVRLRSSMTVQEAFAAVHAKFKPKLEDHEIRLQIRLLAFKYAEETFEVYEGDGDTWEDVVETLFPAQGSVPQVRGMIGV